MELNYKLEEQDYLQLYMYAASKNQVIKQQRQRVFMASDYNLHRLFIAYV